MLFQLNKILLFKTLSSKDSIPYNNKINRKNESANQVEI